MGLKKNTKRYSLISPCSEGPTLEEDVIRKIEEDLWEANLMGIDI